jgi:PAS domain S-box-containing protein
VLKQRIIGYRTMWLRSLRYWAGVAGLAAVYVATGYVGLKLDPESSFATLVWPPSGIALAALLLLGYRFWPGIAAGAFLVNLLQGAPWLTACGIATGNTLEALLGAYLVQRGADFQPALERLRDVLGLIFRAAVLSTLVSATFGVFSLWLGGKEDLRPGPTWLTWWVGDFLGVLVFAPVVLTWAAWPLPRVSGRRWAEAALLSVLLMAVALYVFAMSPLGALESTRLKYAIFPLVIWAALRFGPRGASTATVVIVLLAVWGVTRNLGPFRSESLSASLLWLQFFVGAAALTGLTLAAVVAERAQARALARESETRFSTLAQAVPGILFTNTPDGLTDFTNQQFYDYTGMPPEGANGYGWIDAVHPDDVERTRRQWQACVGAGQSYELELRFRGKDGNYRWFLARAVPLRDDHGCIMKWFGTCIDIDKQKGAEQALREADHRKDEFLAMLAHELRNPLTPIVNALGVIGLRGGDRHQAAVWANDLLERQVGHLVRLVDDLLDVSRITRGVITLRKETVDLAPIVNQSVELVRPLIQARRHELTVVLPAETVRVEADPTRLVQIVANLLSNAAKYTEPGGRIGLSVERQGNEMVLRVTDNGIGIAPNLLPHVFDLFVQAEPSLARSEGGLGIGLTLVRRLAEMHGGRVTAQSGGPHQGSEFVVCLPALPEACLDVPATGSTEESASAEPLRVLVVDDNADAADSMVMLLRMQGHEVDAAYDGATALETARARRPQVVLLDIGLPILSGYEVARRLRGQGGADSLLLVALTGYGHEESRRQARAAGFDHFLVKPVDPAELTQLLATMANGTSGMRTECLRAAVKSVE